MKIVDMKKFIKSIGVILMLIFILSLIFTKATLSHKEIEYVEFYISQGDTLWNIACELQSNNDYYKNKDIRFIINDLKNINNIDSSTIYTNQMLLIPLI